MSERITIVIETDNAAFADGPQTEVARILRGLLNHWEGGELIETRMLRDINGNTCGRVDVRKR